MLKLMAKDHTNGLIKKIRFFEYGLKTRNENK